MSSRETILAAVQLARPDHIQLPELKKYEQGFDDLQQQFAKVLETIGGKVYEVNSEEEIFTVVNEKFKGEKRIVSTLSSVPDGIEIIRNGTEPHTLEDIDLAIINAHFGVAENGAVWTTEDITIERVLPFICQHLAVVIRRKDIVATMQDAYDIIGNNDYGFGAFIAGPSKTADIEQSLVLGAHGPKTMTVFILN